MESLYSAMNVIGPLLLVAVLAWAVLRNRGTTPGQEQRTDAKAHELRDRIDAEDKD